MAFGQTPHARWLSCLGLSAITIQHCADSLAAGVYNWPCGPIESIFLLIPARCLIVKPNYTAPNCPTANVSYSTIYPTSHTPSSLAWVQSMQVGHWPSSTHKLAIGPPVLGHDNPTVCSLAYRGPLRLALRANQESFSIESGPLLDSKAQ